MDYVFKITPLADEGDGQFDYVAIADDEVVPVSAESDEKGLDALAEVLGGKRVTCEPELQDAATRLGWRCAPLPDEILEMKGELTLLVAHEELLAPRMPTELLHDFVQAAASFNKARPWEHVGEKVPLYVRCSNQHLQPQNVLVHGHQGRPGLAIHFHAQDLQRLLAARTPEEAIAAITADTISVQFHEDKSSRPVFQELYDLPCVPVVARYKGGVPKQVGSLALEFVAATLRAVTGLANGEDPCRVDFATGHETGEVVVSRSPLESIAQAAPSARVSRNDPCPCGSGKKAKKCCGANA